LEEEEFERDAFARAEQQVEKPPPVSAWWLVPPIYFVLRRRRDRAYQQRIAAVMRPEEREAFAHLRDVAHTWSSWRRARP
jgi:hypothetical protein